MRFKGYTRLIISVLALLDAVLARSINTTIYGTNPSHVTFEPQASFCARWNNYLLWRTCGLLAQPWVSEVYYDGVQTMSVHRSLNHHRASMTIEFEGSAVWLYGPPRAQLEVIPPDYKVCVHERYPVAPSETCYRVDITAAYSAVRDSNEPVVIFAKGGLRHETHRVVVSVGDPIENARTYVGIQFSHAVYTIERPTPWPVEEDSWRFRKVVMHDTHPLLTYYPARSTPGCYSFWCWLTGQTKGSGWTAKTYRAEDGAIVSWHELKSNEGQFGNNQWGVEATIMAGSVAVYGVPKAHIPNLNRLSHLCIRVDSSQCDVVDVRHAYLNSRHEDEAVLLWRHDALDPSRKTRISIRLAQAGEEGIFAFKSIEYHEPQEYSSPTPPAGRTQNFEIAHNDRVITYHPEKRCVNRFLWWCTEWFDPWVWREEGPRANQLTYRSTIWSYRTTEDPSIELDFRGSAVYVYAAPKTFIKAPFASQHVCINDVCHIVDVQQAYLNAPASIDVQSYNQHIANNQEIDRSEGTLDNSTVSGIHPEYEPVLIWSMTGLDDRVSHRLRLAFATLPSAANAEMTIAKIAYTKTEYEHPRPDPPVPQPDPRYKGPEYPPYAREWAPHHPFPPPPQSTTSPGAYPQPKMPQNQPPRTQPHSSDSGWRALVIDFLKGILITVMGLAGIFAVCLLVLLIVGVITELHGRSQETQRLIRATDETHRYSEATRSGPVIRVVVSNNAASSGYTASTMSQNGFFRGNEESSLWDSIEHIRSQIHSGAPYSNPPPSYTQPPPYTHTFDENQTAVSSTSTVLPPYAQVIRENQERQARAAEYVSQQRIFRSQYQPAAPPLNTGRNMVASPTLRSNQTRSGIRR